VVQEWTQARRLLAASLKVVTWREKKPRGGGIRGNHALYPSPSESSRGHVESDIKISNDCVFLVIFLKSNGRRKKNTGSAVAPWGRERDVSQQKRLSWLNAAEPVSIGGGTWARTSERGQGRRMRGGTGVPASASTSPPGRKQPKRGNRRAAVGMAGAGDRTTMGGGKLASPGFRALPLPGHSGLVCQSEGLAGSQGCVCAYASAHKYVSHNNPNTRRIDQTSRFEGFLNQYLN